MLQMSRKCVPDTPVGMKLAEMSVALVSSTAAFTRDAGRDGSALLTARRVPAGVRPVTRLTATAGLRLEPVAAWARIGLVHESPLGRYCHPSHTGGRYFYLSGAFAPSPPNPPFPLLYQPIPYRT